MYLIVVCTATGHLYSHLRYGCQIWGSCQTQSLHNLEVLQNKALCILNFGGSRENSQPLSKISKIFKLKDLGSITCSLCKIISMIFFQIIFLNYFTKTTNLHDHDTRGIRLNVPIVNTTCYASSSITLKAIREWNKLAICYDSNIRQLSIIIIQKYLILLFLGHSP